MFKFIKEKISAVKNSVVGFCGKVKKNFKVGLLVSNIGYNAVLDTISQNIVEMKPASRLGRFIRKVGILATAVLGFAGFLGVCGLTSSIFSICVFYSLMAVGVNLEIAAVVGFVSYVFACFHTVSHGLGKLCIVDSLWFQAGHDVMREGLRSTVAYYKSSVAAVGEFVTEVKTQTRKVVIMRSADLVVNTLRNAVPVLFKARATH